MKKIDVPEELLVQIVETILKYKKVKKIILFGSRVTGDSKKTSDIDIAISDENWTSTDINIIRHDLNEYLKTPLIIDVLNLESITKEKLKENIITHGVVLYDSGKN